MLNNVYILSSSFKYVIAFGRTTASLGNDPVEGDYYASTGIRGYAVNDTEAKDADRYGENGEDDTVWITINDVQVARECGDDFVGLQIVFENAYRYGDAAAMATAGKTSVGNWTISEGAIAWTATIAE